MVEVHPVVEIKMATRSPWRNDYFVLRHGEVSRCVLCTCRVTDQFLDKSISGHWYLP